MKTKIAVATACLMSSGMALAQTQYDAARFAGEELNGTARFVGMGGAMGALGADISTIGTNPAGIALFRGNDVSTSFGMNATKVKSEFGNSTLNDSRNKASFDQIGFVYSTKIGNRTNLRYFNLAFNYHKARNFNKVFQSGGLLSNGMSQTWQMANLMTGGLQAAGVTEANIGAATDDIYNYGTAGHEKLGNPYHNQDYPFLGVMGVRTGLVSPTKENNSLIGWNGISNGYRSREEGGIDRYDFNMSFNVEDRMYFGVTLGVDDVHYKRSTYYTEDIEYGKDGGYYELTNDFKTEGTGFNLKAGAILRPIEDSPFRLGIAVHTPTWYSLTDTYRSTLYSNIQYEGDKTPSEAQEYTPDYVNGDNQRDYFLITPWKVNVNAGTVVEGIMALGAEYEYENYSKAKLQYDNHDPMENQNSYLKEDLKGVHTLRVGMETLITPSFSLRAGYNYSTAAFKKTAYKSLDYNDMRTDVEYANDFARQTVTVGLGYRGKVMYADAAYKYNIYKSDFYPFSDEQLAAAKLTNERHQVLVTVGVHF